MALIDTCARKNVKKFNLTVKINLVHLLPEKVQLQKSEDKEVYYLKQVFHLLPKIFSLNCQNQCSESSLIFETSI